MIVVMGALGESEGGHTASGGEDGEDRQAFHGQANSSIGIAGIRKRCHIGVNDAA